MKEWFEPAGEPRLPWRYWRGEQFAQWVYQQYECWTVRGIDTLYLDRNERCQQQWIFDPAQQSPVTVTWEAIEQTVLADLLTR